jgi:PPOX class probable F420-dependent enzyme
VTRLSAEQARARLGDARVARLTTVSADGQPHVIPITFAVDPGGSDGDLIYTAIDGKPKMTRSLQRLRNLQANPKVAVLADHYDDDWRELWWARADGTASVIDDPAAMAAPARLLAARYPQYRQDPPAGPVIAIRVGQWSGWSYR